MKNNPIIYIHYGVSKYLEYIFKCAKITNPDTDIILIGDTSNKKIALDCGLIHYQFEDFDYGDDLKTFNEVYELIATKEFDAYKHGKDWNEFVFRKWFVLYNFVKKQGIKHFWHFDTDNAITSDLAPLEHRYLNVDCTVQCHESCFKGFFANPEIIDRYVKKINELFLRKDYIEDFKKTMLKANEPVSFNEMNAYRTFAQEENFQSIPINKIFEDSVFGEIICRSDGFRMEKLPLGEDIQLTHMNPDGRFFCIDEATKKPVLSHLLNLSWMPIYIFDAVTKHTKLQQRKKPCAFDPNSPTLKSVKVPLWKRFKEFRKKFRKKKKF